MRSGRELPIVGSDATLGEAVVEMSGKGMGMTAIVDADGACRGHLHRRRPAPLPRPRARRQDGQGRRRDDAPPRTIGPDRLAIDCVELMETPPKVTELLVVDADGVLVGALHLHDLFRARVV